MVLVTCSLPSNVLICLMLRRLALLAVSCCFSEFWEGYPIDGLHCDRSLSLQLQTSLKQRENVGRPWRCPQWATIALTSSIDFCCDKLEGWIAHGCADRWCDNDHHSIKKKWHEMKAIIWRTISFFHFRHFLEF